jgi:branched-chain amino acid transport system ATP-binding protein
MSPILSIRGVGITFGGVRALDDVSLDVRARSIASVIGPNGAGKTTLFNCITGIYRPDVGSARLDGQELVGLRPHRVAELRLARTFQNIELFGRMSVLDNILLGRHIHMSTGALRATLFGSKVKAEEVRERRKVEEILDFLDLQFARERYVMHLPYGMRKKVELARALALEPKVLLLDEPSAGMNAEEKEALVHVVRDLRDQWGTTVVLVEHDMGLVMGISDQVVVLEQGRVIADGSPEDVTQNPDVVRAYLGDDETVRSAFGSRAPQDPVSVPAT